MLVAATLCFAADPKAMKVGQRVERLVPHSTHLVLAAPWIPPWRPRYLIGLSTRPPLPPPSQVADFGLAVRMNHLETHVSGLFQGTLTRACGA